MRFDVDSCILEDYHLPKVGGEIDRYLSKSPLSVTCALFELDMKLKSLLLFGGGDCEELLVFVPEFKLNVDKKSLNLS